jgi:LPXTG-motif cell wall-anchored protein
MSLDNTPPEEDRPEEVPPEDNQYEEFRDQYEEEVPTEEEPASNGNRTFLRLIGIIGSIIVLAALALAAYFIISRSQLASRFLQQSAQVNVENTAVAVQETESALQAVQAMTQKAILPATWTPTPQGGAAQATATPEPINTTAPTSSGASAADSRTATVVAFLTQSAQGGAVGTPIAQATSAASPTTRATATVRATSTTRATATTAGTVRATATLRVSATPLKTATALPQTGFADEVGLPGLLGLALALIVVVFATRRIRLSISH